jgi:hypothetical protein
MQTLEYFGCAPVTGIKQYWVTWALRGHCASLALFNKVVPSPVRILEAAKMFSLMTLTSAS